MFNLHKNDACSMFWLWPIFLRVRYSNQESDNRLILKKGVGV